MGGNARGEVGDVEQEQRTRCCDDMGEHGGRQHRYRPHARFGIGYVRQQPGSSCGWRLTHTPALRLCSRDGT